MRRRAILNLYDDRMTIADAFKLLDDIGYNRLCFEKDIALMTTSGHLVYINIAGKSLKINISRAENDE